MFGSEFSILPFCRCLVRVKINFRKILNHLKIYSTVIGRESPKILALFYSLIEISNLDIYLRIIFFLFSNLVVLKLLLKCMKITLKSLEPNINMIYQKKKKKPKIKLD